MASAGKLPGSQSQDVLVDFATRRLRRILHSQQSHIRTRGISSRIPSIFSLGMKQRRPRRVRRKMVAEGKSLLRCETSLRPQVSTVVTTATLTVWSNTLCCATNSRLRIFLKARNASRSLIQKPWRKTDSSSESWWSFLLSSTFRRSRSQSMTVPRGPRSKKQFFTSCVCLLRGDLEKSCIFESKCL